MNNEQFLTALQNEAASFTQSIETNEGDWIIKGFIDIYKNIYTVSVDTKIISKVLELLLFPLLVKFAHKHNLDLHLVSQQDFYPDITFICNQTGNKFAVDIKSTYRISETKVNGMTLGAFTGYFRNRSSTKNILYPYETYNGHYIVGVIYSKSIQYIDERRQYTLDNLHSIESVIRDFNIFVQPKYRIASDRPGSGNTKNIGSIINTAKLVQGEGPFSKLGEEIYDDYWMYYLTRDMAQALESKRPYHNLLTYFEYRKRGIDKLELYKEELLSTEDDIIDNEEE